MTKEDIRNKAAKNDTFELTFDEWLDTTKDITVKSYLESNFDFEDPFNKKRGDKIVFKLKENAIDKDRILKIREELKKNSYQEPIYFYYYNGTRYFTYDKDSAPKGVEVSILNEEHISPKDQKDFDKAHKGSMSYTSTGKNSLREKIKKETKDPNIAELVENIIRAGYGNGLDDFNGFSKINGFSVKENNWKQFDPNDQRWIINN